MVDETPVILSFGECHARHQRAEEKCVNLKNKVTLIRIYDMQKSDQ